MPSAALTGDHRPNGAPSSRTALGHSANAAGPPTRHLAIRAGQVRQPHPSVEEVEHVVVELPGLFQLAGVPGADKCHQLGVGEDVAEIVRRW